MVKVILMHAKYVVVPFAEGFGRQRNLLQKKLSVGKRNWIFLDFLFNFKLTDTSMYHKRGVLFVPGGASVRKGKVQHDLERPKESVHKYSESEQ